MGVTTVHPPSFILSRTVCLTAAEEIGVSLGTHSFWQEHSEAGSSVAMETPSVAKLFCFAGSLCLLITMLN